MRQYNYIHNKSVIADERYLDGNTIKTNRLNEGSTLSTDVHPAGLLLQGVEAG